MLTLILTFAILADDNIPSGFNNDAEPTITKLILSGQKKIVIPDPCYVARPVIVNQNNMEITGGKLVSISGGFGPLIVGGWGDDVEDMPDGVIDLKGKYYLTLSHSPADLGPVGSREQHPRWQGENRMCVAWTYESDWPEDRETTHWAWNDRPTGLPSPVFVTSFGGNLTVRYRTDDQVVRTVSFTFDPKVARHDFYLDLNLAGGPGGLIVDGKVQPYGFPVGTFCDRGFSELTIGRDREFANNIKVHGFQLDNGPFAENATAYETDMYTGNKTALIKFGHQVGGVRQGLIRGMSREGFVYCPLMRLNGGAAVMNPYVHDITLVGQTPNSGIGLRLNGALMGRYDRVRVENSAVCFGSGWQSSTYTHRFNSCQGYGGGFATLDFSFANVYFTDLYSQAERQRHFARHKWGTLTLRDVWTTGSATSKTFFSTCGTGLKIDNMLTDMEYVAAPTQAIFECVSDRGSGLGGWVECSGFQPGQYPPKTPWLTHDNKVDKFLFRNCYIQGPIGVPTVSIDP
jgi:hypothetical protein